MWRASNEWARWEPDWFRGERAEKVAQEGKMRNSTMGKWRQTFIFPQQTGGGDEDGVCTTLRMISGMAAFYRHQTSGSTDGSFPQDYKLLFTFNTWASWSPEGTRKSWWNCWCCKEWETQATRNTICSNAIPADSPLGKRGIQPKRKELSFPFHSWVKESTNGVQVAPVAW